jgi:aminoglycoside N3'-acetyltransferase
MMQEPRPNSPTTAVFAPDRLAEDLRRLGVRPGDHLMLHASLRAIGPVEGGAAGVVEAVERAVGPDGTLVMVLGAGGVPEWREPPPPPPGAWWEGRGTPFDARTTPADPEVGWLAEAFRRLPGTLVTDHPLGRFGARGRLAAWLLADPPWHDYYGAGSPLQRLCEAGGRVLRLGADPNTVTLLHWAEYLVPLPRKRRLRRWVAVAGAEGPLLRHVDSLDDCDGIVAWEAEDYFALLLKDYLATGGARTGLVGGATSELIDANELVPFAVRWMSAHLRAAGGS